MRLVTAGVFCPALASVPAVAQTPAAPAAARALAVTGDVAHPLSLTADALNAMPRTKVEMVRLRK